MRVRLTLLAVAALSTALVACNRKDSGETAATGDEAAAPAGKAAPPAVPPAPKRKVGLWEMRMSMAEVDFVQTMRVCLDAATDAKTAVWNAQMSKDMCSRQTATRQPDGSWAFTSVCDMGSGGVVTTQGVASGDFSKRYQVRMTSTTAGAATPQMNRTSNMTMDAAWLGACPEGMKGGDVELPGGVRMNMAAGG
jgi:hypothetical protein